ncbi:AMIN domain-containing protein [Desulfovibrio mangrovi]|uniref:AMIN domain-containing protein n=1 Tax=Desulfovibrio mangrovi TaxID=2976983 RepID=UPI00224857F4|nr:AMIN domain-containing protein [Desulfovibrio mangrovi]UZP68066.1 AMIN domain-containing protein [Desulfovibrio mangrovi]
MCNKFIAALVMICTLMVLPAHADKTKKEGKLAPAVIKNMGVTKDGDAELFCLDFSDPRIPDLETIDDEKKPRLFFDVIEVKEWKGQKSYDIKGAMIKQVRTGYNAESKKLRVVLDLNPVYNYNIEPSYDDRYNLFCIAISARSVRK